MEYLRPDFLPYNDHSVSDSYKFIRMTEDLHDVASYLNDIRLCFVAITVTGYILLVIYAIALCVRRNRRNQPRRRNWDYQNETQREFPPATTAPSDDLTSVRTEVQPAYMSRNHHSRLGDRQPPSFMRHGHSNHQQQTTRLISEHDGSVVKHQIPHITTTDPPPNDKNSSSSGGGSVPQLLKDSVELS